MYKLFFNPLDLVKIKVFGTRKSSWRFRNAIPKERFLLFFKTDGYPEGWVDSYDFPHYDRLTIEAVLKRDDELFYNGTDILRRPKVVLIFRTGKDNEVIYETDDEALKYANDLITKYSLNFEMLEIK